MVVIPSSIAVYGPKTPQMPSERTVLSPTTMYGVTKTALLKMEDSVGIS
jgi:nucleoside-diphosphate-sugar epimerase